MIEAAPPLQSPAADAAGRLSAQAVVEAALRPLRARCEPRDASRIALVSDDLARLDGFALVAHLDAPSRTQYRFDFDIVPVLLAASLGAEALRATGFRVSGRDALLGAVRHRANAARPFHALHASARWLVPASSENRHLLHVAALALTAKGMPHKPWNWEGSPDHGRFSLLQAAGGSRALPGYAGFTRIIDTEDLLPAHPSPHCDSAA